MDQRVRATYWLETPLDVRVAAEKIAAEQSTGTFVEIPGETTELRDRFGARVEAVERLEDAAAPSLPGASTPRGGQPVFRRARVVVSFPVENFGANFPALVTTVMGNLFELREVSGLKLLDLDIPATLAGEFPGPQFGVEGTRRLAGVYGRPIIGTIVKPSVGLAPEQTAELAGRLAEANIDFIKDDELMANPPHSPLVERVRAVMGALDEAADRSGRRVMYAFNVTDSVDRMKRHLDAVAAHGGTCVMVSLNSVGFAAVLELRRECQLPIHGHRNGWGMYTRCPGLGMSFRAYQKLWRLAGVDQLHVNGLGSKFWESDDSVADSLRACLETDAQGRQVMPVVSSGQWGGQAPATYARCRTTDLIYLAGGGIMAHPGGPAAGCRAIRLAWEAAVAGRSLADAALEHVELRQAIEFFSHRAGSN